MRKCIACICLVTVFCCAVLLGGCQLAPFSETKVTIPASSVSKTEFSYYAVGNWSAYLCGEWWIEQEQVGHNLTAHSLKTGETRLLVDTYNNEGVFNFEVFGDRALFNDCFDALHVVDMTKENVHYKVNSSVLAEDPDDTCYIRQAFIHGDDVYIFHNNHFENSCIVERVSLIDNTAVKLLDISGSDTITYLDMRGDALCVYGTENGTDYLREYDRDGKLLGEYPATPAVEIRIVENSQGGALLSDNDNINAAEILGETRFTDWRDDRLWVMYEHCTAAYKRTADGYESTFISPLLRSARYAGSDGDYAFYWNSTSRLLHAFNLSTGAQTAFTIPFSKTVERVEISSSGYIMLLTPDEDDTSRLCWYAVDLTAWF